MVNRMTLAASVALAAVAVEPAYCDVVKVGIIGPMSGPFAVYGQNFKAGIETFVAEHGAKVGSHDVEFVFRDEETPNPAKSKALAQELIIKDKVQYLGGLYFTPDALAVAPLLEEAKVPMVVMNAATSSIVEKSPYVVRTSFTQWQITVPAAKAARARGANKVAIAVSDYGPGIDAEAAFKKTFEADGGTVSAAVRMPVSTTDFGPIMQRIKDSGADMIFAFLPAGPPTLAFVKAYIDNGLKAQGVKFLSTGDLVTEPDLATVGDVGIGILSTYHYSAAHDSAENRSFLADAVKTGARQSDLTMAAVAAYDGARVIYRMLEATDGAKDPDKALAAVKGMTWVSPRGPVTIDPLTRHVTENVYLRELVREGGVLQNKEIQTFADQPDWGLVKN